MAFKQVTSPHAHCLAEHRQSYAASASGPQCRALLALTWQFGWGSLINVLLATATAVICEAMIVKMRGRSVSLLSARLQRRSHRRTAGALALPPLAPWWVVVVGTVVIYCVAKHLYGGLGYNPFNPAMVGYVVLLISFPIQMTSWVTPLALLPEGVSHPGLIESLQHCIWQATARPTALPAPTPLDSFKYSDGLLVEQIYSQNQLFSQAGIAGVGWEWVNLGFLAGGLVLIGSRIFTWHGPVAMLAAIAIMSALFWDGGSSDSPGSPLMHLFSGASMMGAFFILNRPGVIDGQQSRAPDLRRTDWRAGLHYSRLGQLPRCGGLCRATGQLCRTLYRQLHIATHLWPY